MRILVMFDLPTVSSAEKREYRKFRKYLIMIGFQMLQESVYSKLVLNTTSANLIMNNIRNNKPPEGSLFMLTITEKQFAKMEYAVGENKSLVLDTDERLVIL